MLITKGHINWEARIAAQAIQQTRQKLHTRISKRDGGAHQRFLKDSTQRGRSHHSRHVGVYGGTMARPVNLDYYDM